MPKQRATNATRTSDTRWAQANASDESQAVDERAVLAAQGREAAGMAALMNGRDTPEMNDETAMALGRFMTNQSTTDAMRGRLRSVRMSELRGLNGPGRSHFGTRDYWRTFGYPEPGSVSAEELEQRAEDQDIAKIIAEAPVSTTWKHTPIIRDDGRKEGDDPTQFEKDMQQLLDGTIASLSNDDETGVERAGLDTYWQWADRKQRPVQYGLLFFGYNDGRHMDQPVNEDAINGPDDLAYANAFSQAEVTNWALAGDDWVADGLKKGVTRPDKPVLYEIKFERSNPDGTVDYDEKIVHHSRVTHIVEEPGKSEYLGRGCLDALIPRLIDFEKVPGSAAEAHFANVDRKYIGMGSQDGTLGDEREDLIQEFDDMMRELQNDMRSTAYMENMDMEVIGGESVDPSGMLDSLYPFVSGVTGLPQRIMKGSERGDLASTQDDANWFSNMAERQTQFAEPRISRPSINNFIRYGVVTAPVDPDNSYTIIWPSLWELTEIEKATQAEKRSKTLKQTEDAIAMGADRDVAYSWAGIPQPEDAGQTGSGSISSGADPSTNIDEDNAEVQDQWNSIRASNEGDGTQTAVADGGESVDD